MPCCMRILTWVGSVDEVLKYDKYNAYHVEMSLEHGLIDMFQFKQEL